MVVTSARSVEALQEAINQFSARSARGSNPDWSCVPFFAVGQATARALHRLNAPPGSCFPPASGLRVLGGNEAGSGASLGCFIARHYGSFPPDSTLPSEMETTPPAQLLPLLYLIGAHQHPGLSTTLITSRPPIRFTEWKVYTAMPVANPTLQPSPPTPPRWVVFFSPNSAALGLPSLQKLVEGGSHRLRFAAIGPSTRDALVSSLGRLPDAVAVRPQPEALLEALEAADAEAKRLD